MIYMRPHDNLFFNVELENTIPYISQRSKQTLIHRSHSIKSDHILNFFSLWCLTNAPKLSKIKSLQKHVWLDGFTKIPALSEWWKTILNFITHIFQNFLNVPNICTKKVMAWPKNFYSGIHEEYGTIYATFFLLC